MSRGFVKEDDLEHAGTDLPERPVSPYPNYVTPKGLLELQLQAKALEATRLTLANQKDDPVAIQKLTVIDRELRYLSSRLESAILVTQSTPSTEQVLFGATVSVEDTLGTETQYAIVGEDEANANVNKVSWVSPLAKALIGSKIGDTVIWRRPAGNIELTIINIEYRTES